MASKQDPNLRTSKRAKFASPKPKRRSPPTIWLLGGGVVLLLVAALIGRDKLLDIYRQAVDKGYRFYSYGDATLIL